MQVVSTVPTHSLNLFKHPSFRCNGSRFNPSAKPSAGPHSRTPKPFSANEMAKIHLANLEKLLRKQPDPDSGPVRPDDNSKNKPPLLEGLNVAGIWPEMKAAEEMSPRHMNRLQRLLSRTDDRSPKNALGSRWREYHGSHNWSGLLDPLDENLRREVIRYGEFVQAAYHAFHSDPATSSSSLSRHVALPDKCFKVTKSLYATSSVGLPKWVDDVAPDLGWMTQRSSWIGYVAVCDDPREIERMGRRDVVIALRGTATCLEWAENMRELLTPLPGTDGRAKVECGFLSLFKTHGSHVPSLAESVVEEVERIMEMYKGEQLSITVTGHSLGAALALLVADEISTRRVKTTPPIAVFSFGGPRVGNRQFADRINGEKVKTLRIVNSQDVITKIPGVFVSEEGLKNHANAKKLLEPWAYSHVGTELRVETRMSPFLKPDADAACCHDLESYLHLVDGFLSSACPFRANAKRSLAKLLNEQGSNVKKLYTSKVKDLGSLNLKREGKNLSTCLPSPS